jgi:branched-chain amino acid transport system substrate-binding protein
MKKLLPIPLALILISALVFSSCTKSSEATTLKIGGSLPLSGPASVAGLAWQQGWELAVEKINNDGGLNIGGATYMIDLVLGDDKGNTEGATTVANKLCYQDEVDIVLGEFAANTYPPIHEVTSEAGVLLVNSMLPASAAVPGCYADVGPDMPLYIRIAVCHNEDAIVSFQYLTENYPNVKTIGLMALVFPEYQPLADYYATAWAPLGLEVGSDYEMFPPDSIDFTPAITRMMATNPDALFLYSTTPSQFILIVKAARDAGFNGPIIYGPPFDPAFVSDAVPNLSDVITPGFTMDAPNLPDEVKEVIALGRAKYGDELVEDAIFAYDEVMLLAQTLEKAQSIDAQTVQDTFETLTEPGSLQSIFGAAYVGGLETTGVNRVLVRPSGLSRVVNGNGEFIGMFPRDIP